VGAAATQTPEILSQRRRRPSVVDLRDSVCNSDGGDLGGFVIGERSSLSRGLGSYVGGVANTGLHGAGC
jgi:hypothetical protein